MELTGKLERILDPETGQGKNGMWKKQLFVVETLGNYPKKVAFAAWGDKTDALQHIQPGNVVKVFFDPESREFNGKFYTDLKAWRIELDGAPSGDSSSSSNMQNNPSGNASYQTEEFNTQSSSGIDDDLPF